MPCLLSSCVSWKRICKSVLERNFVVAFGICCYCFVLWVSMLNLLVFGLFSWLCCECGMIFVLGVKASLTLGREEKPWGEGVSWALHWSWEILLLERGYFSWSMGSIESHMPFYCSMGGISENFWKEQVWIVLLRHVNIDSLGWYMFLGSLVGNIAIARSVNA